MGKINEVRSVIRALNVLECFLEEEYLSFGGITKRINLSNGTVNRLLKTLITKDFIKKNQETGLYGLGERFFLFGFSALKNFKFNHIVHPILEELTLKTGETSNASIIYDNALIFIDTVSGKHLVKMDTRIGKRNYIHTSASGKIILSYLEEKKTEEILGTIQLKRFTVNTITDKNLFKKEMKQGRIDGCIVDNEEEEIGLKCIAAPVFNFYGSVVGAISISGPTLRINKDICILKKEVIYSCKKASLKLGNQNGSEK